MARTHLRNGNIRDFFQIAHPPVLRRPSTPPSPPSPPPHPPPVSAKAVPAPAARTPLARDAVVIESDRDDTDTDDSDCSLQDLTTLFKAYQHPPQHPPQRLPQHSLPSPPPLTPVPHTLPRAKLAPLPLSSPLALRSRPEFNMDALVSAARRADAIQASFERTSNPPPGQSLHSPAEADPDIGLAPDLSFRDADTDLDVHKARRALEHMETTIRKTWYFFDPLPPRLDLSPPILFPSRHEVGPWALLADSDSRDHHILSGFAASIISDRSSPPDDIFLWVVDSVCHAATPCVLRDRYAFLVQLCPDSINRLFTSPVVDELLLRIGATAELKNTISRLAHVAESPDRYSGRDSSTLLSFLRLVTAIAPHLQADVATHACKLLLRMSLDPFVIANMDILRDQGNAIQALCAAVPEASWIESVSFHPVFLAAVGVFSVRLELKCGEISHSLSTSFQEPSFRVAPLLLLPTTTSRLRQLRRRTAVSFLNGKPCEEGNRLDDYLTPTQASARMAQEDFQISRQTDYVELRALILLLDLAVDDGGPVDDEAVFNAAVDRLVYALKAAWQAINDIGVSYTTRTETKSAIELLRDRLMHSVRTRPSPRLSLFDTLDKDIAERQSAVRRQQHYMRAFVGKQGPEHSSNANMVAVAAVSTP